MNRYILVPFVVWAIAQFLKFVLAASRGRLDFKYLYASGGMPSVHSAVVTSLATTAFLVDGPGSSIFGITVILAAIVMYDSFGVRRASGEQATAINLILDSLNQDRIRLAHPQTRLREILGHKPLEVTIGAFIGLLLGGLLNADKLAALVEFTTQSIGRPGVWALTAASLLILAVALAGRFVYGRRYRKITVINQAVRRSFWLGVVLALIGFMVAFLAYENVAIASWVVWPMILVAVVVASLVIILKHYGPRFSAALESHQEETDKQRWMEGPNKKKRAAKARSKKRK